MSRAPLQTKRPLADRVEVAVPAVAAFAARVLARLPSAVRRRVLTNAFARAEAAFNRGDFEVIFALFDDDVAYVPPPALAKEPINGRAAVLAFWQEVARRFDPSAIENLSIEEASAHRFVRTARVTHRLRENELGYVIRQVTEVRGGHVVAQVNEQIG
jgi:hypothetical protein